MTPTPHDTALEAATKAISDSVGCIADGVMMTLYQAGCETFAMMAVRAYLRTLCADARVVGALGYALREDFKRQFGGHPIPSLPEGIDSWTAEDCGTVECSELAKAALSALCEMGGVR